MEAIGELAPNQASRLGGFSDAPSLLAPPARSLRAVPAGAVAGSHFREPAYDGGSSDDLAQCLELLKRAASTAVEDADRLGFREAAGFATEVEDISRTLEYLQIVAAGAVDRTRSEASAAARAGTGSGSSSGAAVGWTTGWGTEAVAAQGPVGWAARAGGWVTGPGPAAADPESLDPEPTTTGSMPAAPVPEATNTGSLAPAPVPDPADDGCRNAAEFLRTSLRISIAEARRRLSLADAVLPRTGITGHIEPPEHRELAAAVAAGTVASRSATIVTMALERVRHHAPADTMARMEHDLTRHAAGSDSDFVSRIAKRWIEGLDQDGSEPSEEELRRRQGVFLRQPRRGLYHVEVFATADQYEPLLTAMNTATNPRTSTGASEGSGGDGGVDRGEDADSDAGQALDQRTRPQQLLDGLVGAVKAGLTTGALPAAGGLRPQVMVTIDYRDLLSRLENLEHATEASGTSQSTGIPGTGSFTFTGPVTAATIRKIACDADIIPVLLGSQGRILDIGRTTRVFPPHIRKALTARDQGCAFPGCTIPAPWCEAHHITYWSHGGTTSTDNGTLLCSHHHHLVHKEQWQIHVKTGLPWFIPPPHIDPRQVPRRNTYFRC